jgi:hypothetical protein
MYSEVLVCTLYGRNDLKLFHLAESGWISSALMELMAVVTDDENMVVFYSRRNCDWLVRSDDWWSQLIMMFVYLADG